MRIYSPGVLCRRDGRWSIEVRHVMEFDDPGDAIRFVETIRQLEVPGRQPRDFTDMREAVAEVLKNVARRQSVIVNW